MQGSARGEALSLLTVSTVLVPTRQAAGSGVDDDATPVIVLNDNHNTFEWVAQSLSEVLPGVTFERGLEMAFEIHHRGQRVVWSGYREHAELYHQERERRGLTLAPLP
jgi:ATP-dependent Clp protease adapter protein ClpS